MKLAIQVTAMGVKVPGSWGGIGSMANETQVTPMGRREGCLGSVLLCPVLQYRFDSVHIQMTVTMYLYMTCT